MPTYRKLLITTSAVALMSALGASATWAVHDVAPTPTRYADSVVEFGRFSASALFSRTPHGVSAVDGSYISCEDNVITAGKQSPHLNVLGEEDGTGGEGWFNLGDGTSDAQVGVT